jgi:hypothetical protein
MRAAKALARCTSRDKIAEVALKLKAFPESQSWRPTGTTIGAASGIDPSEFGEARGLHVQLHGQRRGRVQADGRLKRNRLEGC